MGIESRYVTDVVNFGEQFDHQQLYDAVQSMDVEAVASLSRTWAALGASAAETVEAFADKAIRRIDEGWIGTAGTAVRISIESYKKTAPTLQEAVSSVTAPLEAVASAVTRLRAEMPEVQPLNLYDDLTPWQSNMDKEHYRRRDLAFDLMRRHYPPAVQTVDTTIPVFDELRQSVKFPDAAGGGFGGGSGGGGGYGGGGGGGFGGGAGGGMNPDAGVEYSPLVPDGSNPDAGGASGVDSSGLSNLADAAASTTAASAGGVGAGVGPVGSPASFGAGAPGSGGSGSGSGGAMGVSPLTGGVPSGTGAPSNAGAGTGGGRPSAGAAAGRVPGGGMMGAGGAGGRGAGGGGDEREHKVPDYLINIDNGNELIGRLPPAVEPVIGATNE